MAGGRKKLSGRQEDIRLQVTLSLCKYIIPEPDRLNAGGNRPGSDATLNDLNDLRQMGRVLHQFDHFESFFDDFVSEIEWGGEDYDGDVELSEEISFYDANEQ